MKKHPGGRPSKFDPKYTKELVKFFDVEPYKRVVSESSKEFFADGKPKKESVKYKLLPNKLPTLYSFSRKIKIDFSTIWRWANKGETDEIEKKIDEAILNGGVKTETMDRLKDLNDFCKAYKEAKELQKEFLISIGLSGAANAPFAIFTAKNVTDMRDNSVITHNLPKPLLDNVHSNNGTEKDTGAEEEN